MKLKHLALFLLTLILLPSCVHRRFEYDYEPTGYIRVVFDWRYAPDANPKSMSLYLFPHGGGEPLRYEFVGREGGIIRVPAGDYDVMCLNSSLRDVHYLNADRFSTFEVTTTQLGSVNVSPNHLTSVDDLPKAANTENQKVMMQPPMMWSSSETGITILPTPHEVVVGPTAAYQEIRMYPRPIVDTYMVTVKNVRNVQYLKSMSGTISDMSDGFYCGPQIRNDASSLISFDLTANVETARAQGMFLTFGHCPDNQRKTHKLMLYAILTDNSKHAYEFEVTDQAHSAPDENGIYHIVVEFIDLPEPTGEDVSITPSVSDWITHYIDLGTYGY